MSIFYRLRFYSLGFLLIAVASFALGGLAAGTGSPAHAGTATTTVPIGDMLSGGKLTVWFCDPSYFFGVCETTINTGDMVVWDYATGSQPHTTTECGASCDSPSGNPAWDSGIMSQGDTFSVTFDTPGTFPYRCEVHPFSMRGVIVVQDLTPTPSPSPTAATPTATSTPTPEPTPVPTPEPAAEPTPTAAPTATASPAALGAVSAPVTLPSGGAGDVESSESIGPRWPAVIAGVTLLLTATAVLTLGLRRRRDSWRN